MAARRHLKAGTLLFKTDLPGAQPQAKAVSGYLFGLSGELAIKEIMRDSGMRPLPPQDRRDDPFFAHFPELKTLLRDTAKGRRQGELLKLAEDGRLFNNWNTDMRYAPTADVKEEWVEHWKRSAEGLVEKMEMP